MVTNLTTPPSYRIPIGEQLHYLAHREQLLT
jgi:hypothetical protein